MDISEIYASGVINKGEEVTEYFKGHYYGAKQNEGGFIVFTNKRFIFLRRPSGWGAKGFNVTHFYSWGDVVSVSTVGLISKRLNLNINKGDKIESNIFSCGQIEEIAKKIIENKNNFVEKKTIEAQTVFIEEANKDKAAEILKKRLARGEITLEEFHQKIQRT
jgi:hypothetical protein